ncbi:hypothetical protein OEA41_006531 [Lepraria neglecta]|uniref:Uncharacterized protein n=1 Tax=Lepraria neglecta TaxID=209136 RepID=A0AAE0DKB2_9LECA|nr:hypothetical protein OEA41_006531 [Lepraria neglecta]
MAEQSRSFRKFMMDPKSSVMTYIADNIPPDRIAPQQGSAQTNPLNGQPAQDPNGFQQNLGQNQPNQAISALSQSSSPQPTYGRPAQSPPLLFGQAYVASNLNQPTSAVSSSSNIQTVVRTETPQWRIQDTQLAQPQAQSLSSQSNVLSMGALGQGPPPAEHNTQETASIAYELEAQAHRIWSLRVEHSWEFEGYSESGHQSVISGWQAQYEMWADTVLDFQEGHSNPSDAKSSISSNGLMDGTAQGWDLQGRQDNSGHQELQNNNMQSHGPMQAQEMPQLQNLSIGQNLPPQANMANFQSERPTFPGAFPPSSPPTATGGVVNQNMPLQQQQQQNPPLQQMPVGQNGMPNMGTGAQNGQFMQPGPLPAQQGQGMPPGQGPYQQGQSMPQGAGAYPQQGQNLPSGAAPSGSAPNMQQGQSMPPGGRPNMQQGQTIPPAGGPNIQQRPNMAQGSAPNMQQRQNMGQGPPSPPRNPTPSGPNMQPYSSPRPGSQVTSSLQVGGPIQGNARR